MASVDAVVATFIFCSVPDLALGLRELNRVLAGGGQLLLLEHVLSHHPLIRPLMQMLSPLMARMSGANTARDTVHNVTAAVFEVLAVRHLWRDMVTHIEAQQPQ